MRAILGTIIVKMTPEQWEQISSEWLKLTGGTIPAGAIAIQPIVGCAESMFQGSFKVTVTSEKLGAAIIAVINSHK